MPILADSVALVGYFIDMLNDQEDIRRRARAHKSAAYGAFAEVSRALSGARRLELVDLLAQGPRTVEALARGIGASMSSTSQHLQVLRRARLVETRREGSSVEYRLAPGVDAAFVALRRLALDRSPVLNAAQHDYFVGLGAPETVDRDQLAALVEAGEGVLLDLRPAAEYAAGHIAGARSLPLAALEAAGDDPMALPALAGVAPGALLVCACRGPFCTLAALSVRRLRAAGLPAVRFEDGPAEWRASGGALEGGAGGPGGAG